MLTLLALVACDSAATDTASQDTAPADTSADTAGDTAGDTADSGADTADTGADTGAGGCPTNETAICGIVSGVEPTLLWAIRMYPAGAALPASDLVQNPEGIDIPFPLEYQMKVDAFMSGNMVGEWEALVVIDTTEDDILDRATDTTVAYVDNPITVVDGVGLDGVDFVLP